MNNNLKLASGRTAGQLRWLGTPSLLSLIVAVAGACASDQTEDSSVTTAGQAVTASQVLINEVMINPDGSPVDNYKYIELKGTPNGTLEGYQLAIVNGAYSGNLGAVLHQINLGTACNNGPCALGSNGLLMITSQASGFPTPAGTTRVTTGWNLLGDNDVTTLILFKGNATIPADLDNDGVTGTAGAAGAPVQGTSGDEILDDVTGTSIADSVGWTRNRNAGGPAGVVYGDAQLSNDTNSVPEAVIRIATNTSPKTTSAWFMANIFDGDNSGSERRLINIAGGGTPPAGVTSLTPGNPNTPEFVNWNGTAGAAGAAGAAGSSSIIIVAGGAGGAATSAAGGAVIVAGAPATGGAAVAGAPGTGGGAAQTGGAPGTGGAAQTGGAPGTGGAAQTGGATAAGGAEATGGAATTAVAGAPATGGAVATGGGTVKPATGGAAPAAGGSTSKPASTTAAAGKKAVGGSSGDVGGETGGSVEDDEDSCSCRAAGTSKTPVSGVAMVVGLAAAFLSRRRRRN